MVEGHAIAHPLMGSIRFIVLHGVPVPSLSWLTSSMILREQHGITALTEQVLGEGGIIPMGFESQVLAANLKRACLLDSIK